MMRGGETALQAARKPNMDRIAQTGLVGRTDNVPPGLTPASDVATLSLFGYDPLVVYTGRALKREEEHSLRRFSKSIIIKDVRSPERLLDEVTLFLHQVETTLPADRHRGAGPHCRD